MIKYSKTKLYPDPAYLANEQISFPLNPLGVNVVKFPES
jgi:hypothetical protein